MTRDSRIFFSRLIVAIVIFASIMAAAFAHFLVTLIVVAGGMLSWLLYLLSAGLGTDNAPSKSSEPLGRAIGKVLAALGVVLTISAFITYGIEQTMWGGYMFNVQGVAAAMLILLVTLAPLVVMQLTSTRSQHETEVEVNLQAPAQAQPYYQPAYAAEEPYDDEAEYFDEEEEGEEDEDDDEYEDDEEEED